MTELAPLLQNVPDLKPGQTVRIHQRIQEGEKERIQVYEGILIRRSGGRTAGATITVRKMSSNIGVEKIFPLHSPLIAKIDVVGEARVRRANLSFLRKPRARQLKTTAVGKKA